MNTRNFDYTPGNIMTALAEWTVNNPHALTPQATIIAYELARNTGRDGVIGCSGQQAYANLGRAGRYQGGVACILKQAGLIEGTRGRSRTHVKGARWAPLNSHAWTCQGMGDELDNKQHAKAAAAPGKGQVETDETIAAIVAALRHALGA